MEKNHSIIAMVTSPAKDAHNRKGRGFSLREIEVAGKNLELLKKKNIRIDYFRKSAHPRNIELLKTLEIPKLEKKKKKPFVKKEKKKTPFKPKIDKVKTKPKKPVKEKPEITPTKPIPKSKKKEKEEPAKLEKVPSEPAGTPLTKLSGLGGKTAKKFFEIGVNNIEELSKENPEELAALISGVSLKRLKKWIDEGKELIK